DGGSASVYYGCLNNGNEVAVKVLKDFQQRGSKEFVVEVKLLMKVHYKNLVPFVGFCDDGMNMIVLYEYMHNGTLRDILSGTDLGVNSLEVRDGGGKRGVLPPGGERETKEARGGYVGVLPTGIEHEEEEERGDRGDSVIRPYLVSGQTAAYEGPAAAQVTPQLSGNDFSPGADRPQIADLRVRPRWKGCIRTKDDPTTLPPNEDWEVNRPSGQDDAPPAEADITLPAAKHRKVQAKRKP
ncbi:hypothetical protein EJ110_NYTH00264, partial [Nymphaea thermarum]